MVVSLSPSSSSLLRSSRIKSFELIVYLALSDFHLELQDKIKMDRLDDLPDVVVPINAVWLSCSHVVRSVVVVAHRGRSKVSVGVLVGPDKEVSKYQLDGRRQINLEWLRSRVGHYREANKI